MFQPMLSGLIGSGLQLTINAAALAPGALAGPIIDQGDGTDIVQVISNQIGQGVVEVTSAGTMLDTQPTLTFASLFTEMFPVTADATGPQENAAAGQATDGGSVMAWQGSDASGSGIFARVFDANGMPLSVEFGVNTTTAGEQTDPALGVAGDRSFVVVWVSASGAGSSWNGASISMTSLSTRRSTVSSTASDASAGAPSHKRSIRIVCTRERLALLEDLARLHDQREALVGVLDDRDDREQEGVVVLDVHGGVLGSGLG